MYKYVKAPREVFDVLLGIVKKRMTPQPVKIRADIEVSCFTYDGIDAIKTALLKGKARETEEIPIAIRLIAPPLYVMFSSALNKDKGISILSEAIGEIRTSIAAKGGTLQVKKDPFVTTKDTDDELEKLMSELEVANAEKDGDDPEDDA